MPWARIDDSLYDHPKLDALGAARLPCVGLNTLALAWSNRYLTDGFIPVDRVRRLGGTVPLADKLVEAGLWEKAGDDYRIHDFAEYNDSKATVLANRQAARERMNRVRSGEQRTNNTQNTQGSSPAVQLPRPLPSVPYQSVPSERSVEHDEKTPLPPALAQIERQRAKVEAEPIRPLEEVVPDLAKRWGKP